MAKKQMVCWQDKTGGMLHHRLSMVAAFSKKTINDYMVKAITEAIEQDEVRMLEKLIAEKGDKVDENN